MAHTKLKRAARARQKRTGERYTEALARVREDTGMPEKSEHTPISLPASSEDYSSVHLALLTLFRRAEEIARSSLETQFEGFNRPFNPFENVPDIPDYLLNLSKQPRRVDVCWEGGWAFTCTAEVPSDLSRGRQLMVSFDVHLGEALGDTKFVEQTHELFVEQAHALLETWTRLHLNVQGHSWFPKPEFMVQLQAPSFGRLGCHYVSLDPGPYWGWGDSQVTKVREAWPNRQMYFENDFFGYQARVDQERAGWEARHPEGLQRTEAVNPTVIYRQEPRLEDEALRVSNRAKRIVTKEQRDPITGADISTTHVEMVTIPEDPNTWPDLPTWENPTTYLPD